MKLARKTRTLLAMIVLVISVLCTPKNARADQNYSQQVFFENSLSPGSYLLQRRHDIHTKHP